MYILETSSSKRIEVEIVRVERGDYKELRASCYFFDWLIEKDFEVYKLRIKGSREVLGLISVERIPNEWRVHIRLLTVSIENKGERKVYDRIAGNLITHAAKIAVMDYAELVCVSLRPKTEIVQYYIDQYNLKSTGLTLSIEMPEILDLINLYDHG